MSRLSMSRLSGCFRCLVQRATCPTGVVVAVENLVLRPKLVNRIARVPRRGYATIPTISGHWFVLSAALRRWPKPCKCLQCCQRPPFLACMVAQEARARST
jgi:hypothetical protein